MSQYICLTGFNNFAILIYGVWYCNNPLVLAIQLQVALEKNLEDQNLS